MHKFIYENDYEGQLNTKVEFTIPSDASLDEILEEFESYLQAVGFRFDGNVDIVPEHSFDDTVRSLDIDPDNREWEYDGDGTMIYKPQAGYMGKTLYDYNYGDVKVTYGKVK